MNISPERTALKRRASPSFDTELDETRPTNIQRREEPHSSGPSTSFIQPNDSTQDTKMTLLADLEQELQCGCCAELVYRPVAVIPCQHFFCGSCSHLWIKNGGSNCPSCRRPAEFASPSRIVQSMVDVLLRAAPEKARHESERQQADEVYREGSSLRFALPKEESPEPDLNRSTEFCTPCPHCVADNHYGWTCPQPIADPRTNPAGAWPLEDGAPPGHAQCGNCENWLATAAPTTTACDLCLVPFCGIGVPDRCIAERFLGQRPENLSTVSDLIQSADVYECFDNNTVEAELMFDYMNEQSIVPFRVYRDIVMDIMSQPGGFRPLIDLKLFSSNDPDPDRPRRRVCRVCAADILLWGLKHWWIRELQKGIPNKVMLARPACPEGSDCSRQSDLTHARKYNHILVSVTETPLSNDRLTLPGVNTDSTSSSLPSASASTSSVPIH